MFSELETGTTPVKRYSVPMLINLSLDPKEEHPLTYGPQNAWARFPMGKILTDYLGSLKKYPPVPAGAADPYSPPAAATDGSTGATTMEGVD